MELGTLNYKRGFAEPGAMARGVSHLPYGLNPSFRPLHRISSLLSAAFVEVQLWMERSRQRRHLMALDDRMLSDIGLTSAQAYGEYRKPVWRA